MRTRSSVAHSSSVSLIASRIAMESALRRSGCCRDAASRSRRDGFRRSTSFQSWHSALRGTSAGLIDTGVSFKLGSLGRAGRISIGQPIPIDFQIPNSPTMTLANNRQTVRDSFQAVPRNLASDNGTTGGRHRAPLRETIADVKTAVDNAVHPKHAAED